MFLILLHTQRKEGLIVSWEKKSKQADRRLWTALRLWAGKVLGSQWEEWWEDDLVLHSICVCCSASLTRRMHLNISCVMLTKFYKFFTKKVVPLVITILEIESESRIYCYGLHGHNSNNCPCQTNKPNGVQASRNQNSLGIETYALIEVKVMGNRFKHSWSHEKKCVKLWLKTVELTVMMDFFMVELFTAGRKFSNNLFGQLGTCSLGYFTNEIKNLLFLTN